MSAGDVMMTKAQETGVQIRMDVPNDMPLMEADRDKIKQVLLNLMSNAIKYNRPNGSVIVTGTLTTPSCRSRFRIPVWASPMICPPSLRKVLSGAGAREQSRGHRPGTVDQQTDHSGSQRPHRSEKQNGCGNVVYVYIPRVPAHFQ